MSDGLRTLAGAGLLLTGVALVVYAGYRQYVVLPEEHVPRHVLLRTGLFVGGLVLALLGVGILR